MYAISKLRPAVLVRRLPGTLRHLSSVEPVVVLSPDAQRIADIQHPKKNVTPAILAKLGRNLHLKKNHPLSIIKAKVEDYCNTYAKENNQTAFQRFDALPPVVTTVDCFDKLLIKEDHVSRKSSDTYYITDTTLLRTHTSAHQCDLMAQSDAFLCSGDVYRRDEVDSSHYPVFHQMEGVRIFDKKAMTKEDVENDLKRVLTGLCKHLFGQDIEMRWNSDYFPFTDPSFEVEVKYMGQWLEVLGSGVIHDQVLTNAGISVDDKVGWAFGLGLERLAMILFAIPDIRLFWTQDERFLSQFKEGQITKFEPYSKYPPCYKDVSFWIPHPEAEASDRIEFHVNEVYEIIREAAGDLVERVELFDEFVHPKTGKKSHAYRIFYRHMERNLLNEEVDGIQESVRKQLVDKLGVELR